MSLKFAYVTVSDTVWSLHKRDICHLIGVTGKDCGGFAQLCYINVCIPGAFLLQSLGGPGGLPLSFDVCESLLLLQMSLKSRPRSSSKPWSWRRLHLLGFIFISVLHLFLYLDSYSSSCCDYPPSCNCPIPFLTPPYLSWPSPSLKVYLWAPEMVS